MTASETTRARFHVWMDRVLPRVAHEGVAAFVLHLYEGIGTVNAQIAGSSSFALTSRDWAGGDAFPSGEQLFALRRRVADNSWHEALRLYLELMEDYSRTGHGAEVLAAARGVGVGFVDGDLILLRPAMTPEPVHAVLDYFDGVKTGVAEFNGEPHAFHRDFDEAAQDWTNFYRLKPLNEQEFNTVMAEWAIWTRWLAAYKAGAASLNTHPALPEDTAMHQDISAAVAAAMSVDDARSSVAWATFDGQLPPDGTLQVHWRRVAG